MFIGILAFTLNEGLRFGRWIDYNNYYMFYEEALLPNQERFDEPLFVFLCRFVDAIGGQFQWLIMFMSFMLIFAGSIFIRQYKEVSKYAFPFFAVFSYFGAENLVRWYLAFSFFLIALSYLLNSKRSKKVVFLFFLYSFVSVNFHFGMVMIIPLFVGIYLIKWIVHPILSISIYISLLLLFKVKIMSQLVTLINVFSVMGGRMESYADNAEYWLTSSALGLEGGSSFLGIATTALYFLCIIVGWNLVPLFDKKYQYAYNLFTLGFLMNPISSKIEILDRIDQLFLLFIFIVLAYVVRYTIEKNVFPGYKFLPFVGLMIILNFGRVELSKPFKRKTTQLLYIWDKNGREYLDNYDVYFFDMYNAN